MIIPLFLIVRLDECLVNYKCSVNISCDCHLIVVHLISLLLFAYHLKLSLFLSDKLDENTLDDNIGQLTWE